MPRIRGRPRQGASWYAAESRRKRHKKFAQAIRAARRKRKTSSTTILSPPRTFGEEDPPFIHSQTALSSGDPPQSSTAPSETYAACIVVEEIPGCAGTEETPACVIGEQEHPPNATTMGDPPQSPIALSETYAPCVVEEEIPDYDTGKQEHETGNIRGPEVIQEEQKLERNSPPLLHPNHLKLIFEMRSLVDDQAFRTMGIHQRLDLLYAAYSDATPRRQCPTCAQPFVFPQRSKLG